MIVLDRLMGRETNVKHTQKHRNLRGKTSPAREEEKTTGKLGFHYLLENSTSICMVARVSQALILNNQEAIDPLYNRKQGYL